MSKTPSNSVGIALLGAGVVGRGVLNILSQQTALLKRRTGITPVVKYVVCRNLERHADLTADHNVTTDALAAVNDPDVQIVVEVMGGTGVAGEYTAAALKAGKHVVTANKALLAAHGAELFGLAKQNKVSIGFEASCGGGIPIIDALTRGLVGNRLDALIGIINGTCNYILSQMATQGWSYENALAEAQKIGFAEADPVMDVSGRDTAQKLAILASLAFNEQVVESDITLAGIDAVHADDIRIAGQLGYAMKLLAVAQRTNDGLALRVSPTLVHKGDLFGDVNGGFNAISVYGHAIGHQFFYGRGAGQLPTASAVVADILGVAMGTIPHAFERLSVYPGELPRAKVQPAEVSVARRYLRVMVKDQPGVFGELTQALGRAGISLAGVQQEEADAGTSLVPVIFTTHECPQSAINAAINDIENQPATQGRVVVWPILERPEEFAE